MQISVSANEKTFSSRNFRPIFAVLMLLLFAFLAYAAAGFYFAKSALEELIDDEVVWQEVKNLPIAETLLPKMLAEIEGIKAKVRSKENCVQYSLVASVPGFYPCFQSESGKIFLNVGECWKIGKTCLAQEERYTGGFPDARLILKRQFEGTETQCLIVEKIKIYAYRFSQENLKRTNKIDLPPGNKIHR